MRLVVLPSPLLPTSAYVDLVAALQREGTAARVAYLAFGDTYAAEQRCARELRWPTRTLDGAHLLFLYEPEQVSAAILGLLRELETPRPYE